MIVALTTSKHSPGVRKLILATASDKLIFIVATPVKPFLKQFRSMSGGEHTRPAMPKPANMLEDVATLVALPLELKEIIGALLLEDQTRPAWECIEDIVCLRTR